MGSDGAPGAGDSRLDTKCCRTVVALSVGAGQRDRNGSWAGSGTAGPIAPLRPSGTRRAHHSRDRRRLARLRLGLGTSQTTVSSPPPIALLRNEDRSFRRRTCDPPRDELHQAGQNSAPTGTLSIRIWDRMGDPQAQACGYRPVSPLGGKDSHSLVVMHASGACCPTPLGVVGATAKGLTERA